VNKEPKVGMMMVSELDVLRADLAAANARAEEAESHAKRLEEYMLKGVAFRDELQFCVKGLEEALVNLMKSADASWYSGRNGGHDWREAIDAAHLVLVKCSRASGGGNK